MKHFCILIIIIPLFGCINKHKDQSGIPFEYKDYIVVSAIINDSITAKLLFDTGATGLYLDSSFVSKTSLSKLELANAVIAGAGNQGHVDINIIKSNISCKIDTFRYYSDTVPILNLQDIVGSGIDGIIGIEFVKNYLLKIDFYNKRLHLLKSAKDLKTENSIPFIFSNNRIYINAETEFQNGKKINGQFLLDLGSQGALSFTSVFAQKSNFNNLIYNKQKYIIQNGGVSGKSSGYDFRVNYVKLGNIKFNRPVLDYSLDTLGAMSSNSYIGLVGLEFLNRLDLIFDFTHNKLYLEPNKKISDKFKATRTGFYYLLLNHSDSLRQITSIYEGSIADKKGLRLGDTILKINSRHIKSFTNKQIDDLFDMDKEIHFVILRNGKECTVNIIPKEQI